MNGPQITIHYEVGGHGTWAQSLTAFAIEGRPTPAEIARADMQEWIAVERIDQRRPRPAPSAARFRPVRRARVCSTASRHRVTP